MGSPVFRKIAADAAMWRGRWLKQRARLTRALRGAMRRAFPAVLERLSGRAPSPRAGRAAHLVSDIGAAAIAARSAAGLDGRFSEGDFGNESRRRYMLYQPAFREPGPAPLLVLLHGCHQGAEEFAAGTRMNEAAEDTGVIVLYPEQSVLANAMRCWNWYTPKGGSGNEGEAALIAALTRQVMRDHEIDPARVYVAGMSAGGAMAAVLAREYPGLYAALGVHSGVPAGLAHDLFSAIRLMSNGPAPGQAEAFPPADESVDDAVASIVFHGDKDMTVHPSNGHAIHAAPGGAQARGASGGSLQATIRPSAGQRGFTRTVDYGAGGVTNRELWIVHGAGHAWAGGSDEERYTDADGPDASREMLRFLLQHRLTA